MSTNPQWSKFQPPIMNSDPSILDFKTLTTAINDDHPNFRGFSNPFQVSESRYISFCYVATLNKFFVIYS